jgi:hypothetical protein
MALFYWSVWRGLRNATKDARLQAVQQGFFDGAAAGLLAFLLAGFAGSSLTPVPEQSFLWLAFGAINGLAARSVSEAPANVQSQNRDDGAALQT